MILKKDKELVLNEIRSRASGTISSHLQSNLGAHMRIDTNSLAYTLQEAISMAITDSFRVLIENQYTDDDFEKDITLKS